MKKVFRKSILLIVVAVIVLGIIFIPKRVEVPADSPAKIIYNYGNKNIEAVLSEKESRTIARIFNGRAYMLFEIPACFFSDKGSIWFGDDYSHGFCPAFDDCCIVYDKKSNAYFRISYLGCEKLHKILEKYGFDEWE